MGIVTNIKDYRDIAIAGTNIYLNHLTDKGGGESVVQVLDIQHDVGNAYWLMLDSSLKNMDSAEVRINGQSYDSNEVQLVVYDKQQKRVKINVASTLIAVMDKLKPADITIVSDMRFLVKRVLNWYSNTTCDFKIHGAPSTAPVAIQLKQSGTPFDEQNNAIHTVLQSKFSYVWGAPGTGKTKLVLARCVLAHINAGHKVLLTAPTNNAVEQTLYGVLPVLQEAGVLENDTVLRLGTASPEFSTAYPNVCEDTAATSQMELLKDKRDSAEQRIPVLQQQLEEWKKYKQYQEAIVKISDLKNHYQDDIQEIAPIREKRESKNTELVCLETELQQKREQLPKLTKEIHSSTTRLEGYKSGVTKYSTGLRGLLFRQKAEKLAKQRDTEYAKLMQLQADKKETEERLTILPKLVEDCRNVVNQYVEEEQEHLGKLSACIPDELGVEELTLKTDWGTFEESLTGAIQNFEAQIPVEEAAFQNQDLPTEADLQSQLKQAENDVQAANQAMNNLSAKDVKVRMQTCKVLAATIDSCIGRVSPTEHNFNQVFLDEAAYASYVKAAILYCYSCPIAMLGDHMQLPPVCEMDQKDFKKHGKEFAAFWAIPAIYLVPELSFIAAEISYNRYLGNKAPEFIGMRKANLTRSYRFSQSLAETLDTYIYKNGLTGNNAAPTELYCKNVSGAKGDEKRVNSAECRAIKEYCKQHADENFAILTPYNAQKKLLMKNPPENIARERWIDHVCTIHGSQGQEWDTVILSVVDTADKFMLSTVANRNDSKQLLNTALSRAKKKLIIVCDMAYWDDQKELLSKFLAQATIIPQNEQNNGALSVGRRLGPAGQEHRGNLK